MEKAAVDLQHRGRLREASRAFEKTVASFLTVVSWFRGGGLGTRVWWESLKRSGVDSAEFSAGFLTD
jgi:hypothetical protein